MQKFFRHFFLPHHKNNHRAKILHHSSLIAVFIALLFGTVIGVQIKNQHSNVLGISYSISTSELLADTNKMRAENRLPALQLNSELSQAAAQKASDMFTKNYWAHFAPDGSTTPWVFIKNSGYDYLYAGENLAKGFTDSNSIITAWMNSPTHRDNLLSPKYKDIGFAVKEGSLVGEDTVLVVQMFGATDVVMADTGNSGAATKSPGSKVTEEYIPKAVNLAPAQKGKPAIESVHVSVPQSSIKTSPLINVRLATKSILIILLVTFLATFVLDLVIIEKKKIPRIVGHNLDHIILIILFLLFVILQSSGGIL